VLADTKGVDRVVCYCKSCQAFAHFLGRESEILDELGGSDIVQTRPSKLTFTDGAGSLACMRLTEKGMLRWYAACCMTPVGNTLPTGKVAFVGLARPFIETPERPVTETFGSVMARSYTGGARADAKPRQAGMLRMMFRLLSWAARARLDGSYRRSPFFSAETDTPVAAPRVLSTAEHAELMRSVEAAAT
jgi:hypothetical protein